MVQKLANKATHGYDWIDLDYSDKQAFLELARTLSLHEECIIDAFQADHVPKYQQLPHYLFIILRVYINPDHREGDTLRELTDKIARRPQQAGQARQHLVGEEAHGGGTRKG